MKTSLHRKSSHKNADLTQETLQLEAMGCATCVSTIETVINNVSGVAECSVNVAFR